jgi:hypothetical protein
MTCFGLDNECYAAHCPTASVRVTHSLIWWEGITSVFSLWSNVRHEAILDTLKFLVIHPHKPCGRDHFNLAGQPWMFVCVFVYVCVCMCMYVCVCVCVSLCHTLFSPKYSYSKYHPKSVKRVPQQSLLPYLTPPRPVFHCYLSQDTMWWQPVLNWANDKK